MYYAVIQVIENPVYIEASLLNNLCSSVFLCYDLAKRCD